MHILEVHKTLIQSIVLLATQGMVNPEIKKVLAYSTGSQIGYMMLALGVAGLSHQYVDGYTAGFFHLISHAMFKASLFMAAGSLLHVVGSRFMTDMGGLKKQMKKTYAFMWAAGLGLMGAPFITTGFWSKDAIFATVYESGNEWALPVCWNWFDANCNFGIGRNYYGFWN